jgi:PHD/YefM family antitoxin component YafN of YafNO toxin-antitoxin module
MDTSELDERLFKSIRGQFGRKKVKITVSEYDETDYLLQNEANRKRLLEAVERVEKRSGLKEIKLEDLK